MVAFPEGQPNFVPAAIWCCRCQRSKPLEITNCSGMTKRKSSTGATSVIGKNGEFVHEDLCSDKMESCGHRTCETCEWITSNEVRTPISIPTYWTCGTCANTRGEVVTHHVVDILRGSIRCQCAKGVEVTAYKDSCKPHKKRQPGRKPVLIGVYDQFGKRMPDLSGDYNLQMKADRQLVTDWLWQHRAAYWIPELNEPGSMIKPTKEESAKEVTGQPNLKKGENGQRTTEEACGLGKCGISTFDSVKRLVKRRKPRPTIQEVVKEPAPEEVEAKRLEDEKWERLAAEQENEYQALLERKRRDKEAAARRKAMDTPGAT